MYYNEIVKKKKNRPLSGRRGGRNVLTFIVDKLLFVKFEILNPALCAIAHLYMSVCF